jgi:hypothetical protein
MLTQRGLAKFLEEQAAKETVDEDDALPVLWQYLTKAHIGPSASDDEWTEFVRLYEGQFADEVSELDDALGRSRDRSIDRPYRGTCRTRIRCRWGQGGSTNRRSSM